jgi:tRNA threonylcarbamoyladenosine biosynthesis protein TsaE
MKAQIFVSNNPASTIRFGQRIGEKLTAGDIIALIGDLGCGKTLLTRGICLGLSVDERYVNSPTFVFANEYTGKLPVYHLDLYRIKDVAEGVDIGLLDYLAKAQHGVLVLEWAEKALSLLPANYLRVSFSVLSARIRRLELTGFDDQRFGNVLKGTGK